MFIIPEHQNRGYGAEIIKIIEKKYDHIKVWKLETIIEENRNCHFYEKMGYMKTGKIDNINERMNLVYYEKLKI